MLSKSVNPRDAFSTQESEADIQWEQGFTVEERRAKRCQYNGKRYPQGATIERALKPDYERCDRCTCIGRKFRNCTTIFICENGYLNCGKEDYEFQPGECCPVCKRENCREDRKVGDKWQRVKNVTVQDPLQGICSLCECRADRKEYCKDSFFTCYKIPGCLEYETKPDFCCPRCKTWAKETTTEVSFTIQPSTEGPTFPPFPSFVVGDEEQLEV